MLEAELPLGNEQRRRRRAEAEAAVTVSSRASQKRSKKKIAQAKSEKSEDTERSEICKNSKHTQRHTKGSVTRCSSEFRVLLNLAISHRFPPIAVCCRDES